MKALVLTDYNKLELKEVPLPVLTENEVLVRVKSVGICGSDVHGMDGSTGRRQPPVIMGHEASGIIESVGENVTDWRIGDRVTFDSTIYQVADWYSRKGFYNLSDNRKVLGVSCDEFHRDGAFATHVAIPQHILYKIPDTVSFEYAAMVEPVAVAIHAVKLSNISLNDSVLVGGAGIIGLFIIQVLKLSGATNIMVFDIDQSRLDLALKMGATHIFNSASDDVVKEVKELTHQRGADIGFEVVGHSTVLNSVIAGVRKGATITLVGNVSPLVDLPLQIVVSRQLRLQGSCAICGEYEAALDLIARNLIKMDPMMSAVVPLAEGPAWFKRLYNREPGLMKVILQP